MKRYVTLVLLFITISCLQEGAIKKPFLTFEPLDIGDGWIVSSPEAEGIDAKDLEAVYQDVYASEDTWMMKSLLVFRNGKLVAESYLKDEMDRTKRAAIWSCTKQVTAILTGMAIEQGFLQHVQDPIENYLPDYTSRHPDKKDITIENLLTMQSGINFNNGEDNDVLRQHKTDNSLEFVLSFDLRDPIGTEYKYKDSDPQIISGVMHRATGMNLDEFGKEFLLDPLGIQNFEWTRYSDGLTLGAWGILTTPRELAKIGQCVLDSGRHQGIQLIPKQWWTDMLSVKVENAHDDAAFGYYWWSIPSKGWYFMWGHGGQYVFLKPAKRLMVVVTSLPQVDDDLALWYDDIVVIAGRIDAATE